MADIVRHFNIAGNYIDKQYVAVQNVLVSAPHLAFTQITNNAAAAAHDRPTKPAKAKTVTPKRSPHFLETPAFVYKFSSSAFDGQRRLTVLFQYLRKEYEPARTWIDPDTNPDDFLSLFSGGKSDKVIVWTESKQKLFALFKRMKERKIITTPKGYGIWTIVQNHFSDWHGNMFHNLNKEHMPEERVFSVIEAFIDILDPAVTSAAQLDEYAKKVGRTFGNR
ncbi:MAG: hypothetical protein K5660_03635 [Paludibacteraceae bacterium]|nr:hypothetical protein [Paludibacteraceae bacterium]